MAERKSTALGMDYRKESDKLMPRALFFGLVLLMSHFLKIRPSEIDTGGIKIEVKDIIVIHGGIALISLYYSWVCILYGIWGSWLYPLDINKATHRQLLINSARSYVKSFNGKLARRDRKQRKLYVRLSIAAHMIFVLPYALATGLILLCAFIFGIWDFYNLVIFVFDKLPVWDLL